MTEAKILMETDRFAIYEFNGRKMGFEKPFRVHKDDHRVLVGALDGNIAKSTSDTLEKLGIGDVWKRFRKVGLKVNLCGGISGCPATFTDPLVVEGVIEHARAYGAEPFVCEGDMRGFIADERLIRRRGELAQVLDRTNTRFVNLSQHPVPFTCLGLEKELTFPEELLDPETAVVSVAVPKDHWECGISMAQKNMYGAISERRKALYHRGWSRIDRAVAAAARILRPDVAIVGGRWAGVGWGPHFCIPVDWRRIVVGVDAMRVDKCMADIYNYPYDKVQYAQINARGEDITYHIEKGSADWPDESARMIKNHAIGPIRRLVWKGLLFPQYFLPHRFQHRISPLIEDTAAGFHHRFIDPLAGK